MGFALELANAGNSGMPGRLGHSVLRAAPSQSAAQAPA